MEATGTADGGTEREGGTIVDPDGTLRVGAAAGTEGGAAVEGAEEAEGRADGGLERGWAAAAAAGEADGGCAVRTGAEAPCVACVGAPVGAVGEGCVPARVGAAAAAAAGDEEGCVPARVGALAAVEEEEEEEEEVVVEGVVEVGRETVTVGAEEGAGAVAEEGGAEDGGSLRAVSSCLSISFCVALGSLAVAWVRREMRCLGRYMRECSLQNGMSSICGR